MSFTEEIMEKVSMDLHGTTKVPLGEYTIDFARPYRRVSMTDAIKEYTGIDITGMSEDDLRKECDKIGIGHSPSMGKGKLIDLIFWEK